jgi:hypothetical protein
VRQKGTNPDQISRSLLQKAVRRGDSDLVLKSLGLIIRNNDFDWLSKRLAVIVFEECWTFGFETKLTNNIEDIVSDYLTITKSVKNKNAAGLGSLAFEMFKGDNSIMQFVPDNKPIRIIAEAIKKPELFWAWINSQNVALEIDNFLSISELAYKKASWPWDKAFCLAGAYLAVFEQIPVRIVSQAKVECPIWVGIDKHTPEGKIAIDYAAKIIGINKQTARWLSFNFEGAICNESEKSFWWDIEINWRLQKLRLDYDSGMDIWIRLQPLIINFLDDEIKKLSNKLDIEIDEHVFKANQTKLF